MPLPISFLSHLLASVCLVATASAFAQSNVARVYDIPAQPLSASLIRIASEGGVRVSVDAGLVLDLRAPAVRGSFTPEMAMRQALAGTALDVTQTGSGVFTLRHGPTPTPQVLGSENTAAAPRPTSLAEVQVVASAERDATTEGTGQYASNAPSATSTRLPLEWQETPQSLTILTRQRLDDQRLDTLDSAVETAIGVVAFRQSLGSDLRAGLMSRGFTVSSYEIDGIPTSSFTDPGQSSVLYDRIEIVRGATGLMSGLGTPGATVNLMRKRPTVTMQGSVTVDAGSWNRRGGTADVSGPLNESASVRGRLVVDARNSDSYVDRYRSQHSTFYGIVEADLTDDTLVTAGFSQQRDDNTVPLRTGFPLYYSDGTRLVLPRSYNSSPNWSYFDSTARNGFVSLEHRFSNGWRGKLEFNHREYSYDGVVSYLSGSIDPATGNGGEIQAAKWNNAPKENTLDGYVTGHFPLFGREHELVAGFTLGRMRDRNAPSYGWFQSIWTGYDGSIGNIHTWDGNVAPPVFTLASRGDTEVRQNAAYATSRFHLTDAASLIVGARVTNWEESATTRPVNGMPTHTVQRETGVLTPYAGVVYRFNDAWTAYGSYTQIFNPQDYGSVDISGNRLDPEEGTSVEGGLKTVMLGGQLQASASVFQTKLENSAIRDERIQQTRVFIAQKGLTSRGMELELAGQVARGWNLSAGYALTSTTDAQGKDTMTQIPRHSIKLFSTYRLPMLPALTIGGGVTWQTATGYPGAGLYTQGTYAVVNLLARYEINRNLTAALNVGNVLARTYYTGTATHALYGAPRNVVGTLTYRF